MMSMPRCLDNSSEGSAPSERQVPELLLDRVRTEVFKEVVRSATNLTSGGIMLPKDSLYGSAIVLPQVARSLGNHPFYVGKALITWMCLAMVLTLQCMFTFEVYRLVAQKDECCTYDPDPCEAEGFTPGGYAIVGSQRTRWYLCHPELDGGSAMQILWKLCLLACSITLFKDLRQSCEMGRLFWLLPNEPGRWMVVTKVVEDSIHVDATGGGTVVEHEDHRMVWQVDSMERSWKLGFCIGILIPKLCIFWCLWFYGSMWLMSVGDRANLIMNAVALVFIVELDKAVFAAVTTADVQQYMDNLRPWYPPDPDAVSPSRPASAGSSGSLPRHGEWGRLEQDERADAGGGDDARNAQARKLHALWQDEGSSRSGAARAGDDLWPWEGLTGPWYMCKILLGVVAFPLMLVMLSVSASVWYDLHCHGGAMAPATDDLVCNHLHY